MYERKFPRHVEQVLGVQNYDDPEFQPQLKELLKVPVKQARLEHLFPGVDSGVIEKYLRRPDQKNTPTWERFLREAQKKFKTPQQLFNALARSGELGL